MLMPTPLETPCREWQGGKNGVGYGVIYREPRKPNGKLSAWLVHHWVWTLANGPILDGMVVLHRCDNPPCFRLDHLVLGTRGDNHRDMVSKGRNWQVAVTHCPQGHPYDDENLYLSPAGRRNCRECMRGSGRRYRAKKLKP